MLENVIATLNARREHAMERANHYRRVGDMEMESFLLGKLSGLSDAIEQLQRLADAAPARSVGVRNQSVECPTCEADPGRACRGMEGTNVHFTRAMRAG